ncbi:MAG: hypothetical protein JOY82_20165 [Streptosporangiaceae bacterium]|nr:hypothetical protein [Streptosporangiaceae bacterium]MBV9856800.1 hypothetical protein [Streptosporangiaceae bacterium]
MNPAIAVEVIIGIFFALGIAVGVIAVIALSALKNDRERRNGGLGGTAFPPHDGPTGPTEPPGSAPDGPEDHLHRWPDSAGDGFYRR